MTTMRDMIADTRRMAYGSMTEQINLVAVSASAGATSITMDMDVSGITPGMVLSCDLNVWYVRSTVPAQKIVNVIPGYDNSPLKPVEAGDFVTIKHGVNASCPVPAAGHSRCMD